MPVGMHTRVRTGADPDRPRPPSATALTHEHNHPGRRVRHHYRPTRLARRWRRIMCQHHTPCPAADAVDREAAHVVASHPEQGWSLLCNGVVLFEDTGALLPNGQSIPPPVMASVTWATPAGPVLTAI